MTPFSLPLSTFTTTAISLTTAVGLSSCQHQEDGVFNTGGAKRPEDWVLTVPEKRLAYTNPHSGTRARTRIYNLSTIAPFAAYRGQEVHLSKLAPFFRHIGSKFKPRLLVSIWRMCVCYITLYPRMSIHFWRDFVA